MKNTFIDWQQDWSQLLGGCNWYTFRFCLVEFEWDKMLGGVGFTIVILGLGFRVRHNYAETDGLIEIKRRIQEFDGKLEADK